MEAGDWRFEVRGEISAIKIELNSIVDCLRLFLCGPTTIQLNFIGNYQLDEADT